MNVSPNLQSYFDSKEKPYNESVKYIEELDKMYGFYTGYKQEVISLISSENISFVSDDRVKKAILDGNRYVNSLINKYDLKKEIEITNISNNIDYNPYLDKEA